MSFYNNSVAATRISQAMSRVSSRLDTISAKTGLSFGSQLRAAQQTAAQNAAAQNAEAVPDTTAGTAAETEEIIDLLAPYYEDAKGSIVKNGEADIVKNNTVDSSSKLPSGAYDDLIAEISEKYDIDPLLIKAVCYAESSYRADVTSKSGAMGLMQLMPATAKALGVEDAYDPEQNMDGGVRYLLTQIERFDGDVRKAIAAYNCGPGRVSKLDDLTDASQLSQLPTETQNYLKRIESLLASVNASYILDEDDGYRF